MYYIDQAENNRMNFHAIITNSIWEDLLGVATKKMRGITSNYQDEILEVIVFFESELTEEENSGMMEIKKGVTSNVIPIVYSKKGEPIFTVKEVLLKFTVAPSNVNIFEKMGNIGWHYLRKEYL
ncbi:hypothetical protein [Rosenbergiella nectarea]|uniref:hypothetical protein n=1 Tax=Rosenbergiella nectarea TaxID=988801 RepID=UPI001BD93FCE|nr:hypothetical protein [Rosenbergiella nectarea]MBT0729760.1 hypothetical protein [Rosenbergiella nectarea subsp. apis]